MKCFVNIGNNQDFGAGGSGGAMVVIAALSCCKDVTPALSFNHCITLSNPYDKKKPIPTAKNIFKGRPINSVVNLNIKNKAICPTIIRLKLSMIRKAQLNFTGVVVALTSLVVECE